jgi:hypothetical protein
MRGILLFKSKLAALLVGMTVMLAVPVVGAIAIAYTILPDIGVFSSGQKIIIWAYGILCLLSVVYAYLANWMFLDEVWHEYLPGNKKMKYYIGLIILPVIGSFFMLYLYFRPSFKASGTVKRCCIILITSTIVDVVILTILFFAKAGLEWILLVAGIFCIFHYILLITMACKLAKDPIGRPAKIIITIMLVSLFCAVGFMASSTWIIDSKIAKAKKELADIYRRLLTAEALKELYYHGLEPNYKKFEKILPRDPEDEEYFLSLPEFSEELTCFYKSSLTSTKLDKQLAEWVKSKKTFFKDFDRIIKHEKYFKMPESVRDYDGLLLDLSLPELNHLRHWARVVKMRIKNAINNNDKSKILPLFKQIRRIRNYSADGHCLIAFLVTIALEEIRFRTLEIIVARGNLKNAKIYNLIDEIKKHQLNWKERYNIAMYGNAVIDLDAVEWFASRMDSYMYFYGIDNKFLKSYLLKDGYLDSEKPFSNFLIASAHLVNYREMLYALKFLIVRAKAVPKDPIIQKNLDNIPEQLIFCKIILGNFSQLWERSKTIRNVQNSAVTALRIELYRRKYKKLPDDLSDLVPEFMSKIPIDLLSGKPLKYIHGEITLPLVDGRVKYSEKDKKVPIKVNGYRIYGVGYNKKDDNGYFGDLKGGFCDDIGFSVIDEVVKSKVSR